MCPTFLATGDETMSTRGRANTIRAALERRFNDEGDPLLDDELETVLSNCLSCKACASECPSNVDLALLKAELMNARHHRRGLSVRERLLSSVDVLGEIGCLVPSIANSSLETPWIRNVLERYLGISKNRPLPSYTFQRFDAWFARRPQFSSAPRGKVILWDDTFVRYHEPRIGKAAVVVLEAAGFEVVLLENRACCGRPAFSQGNLDRAARLGRLNLELLKTNNESDQSVPILFLEPSCYSMFVSDYRELRLSGAEEIASRCFLFEQFVENLLQSNPSALSFNEKEESISVHAHCHIKAMMKPEFLLRLVECIPGRKGLIMNTGCCGMAGAFGALQSKYELSVSIGKPLADQIEQLGDTTTVIASGTSCRHQIQHLTPIRPKHMAELLAAALR